MLWGHAGAHPCLVQWDSFDFRLVIVMGSLMHRDGILVPLSLPTLPALCTLLYLSAVPFVGKLMGSFTVHAINSSAVSRLS